MMIIVIIIYYNFFLIVYYYNFNSIILIKTKFYRHKEISKNKNTSQKFLQKKKKLIVKKL